VSGFPRTSLYPGSRARATANKGDEFGRILIPPIRAKHQNRRTPLWNSRNHGCPAEALAPTNGTKSRVHAAVIICSAKQATGVISKPVTMLSPHRTILTTVRAGWQASEQKEDSKAADILTQRDDRGF
jgi:hypothetical protein